jgi:hypothetical protein
MKSRKNYHKPYSGIFKFPNLYNIFSFCNICLISLFILFPVEKFHSQANQPDWPKYKKYEGILSDDYLRVTQIKKKLQKGEKSPEILRMIFAGYKGNYLEFYDKNGVSVLIKYREDRFDKESTRKYTDIIPGLAYEIDVDLIGLKILEKKVPISQKQEFLNMLKKENAVLIFKIFHFKLLRINQIRF